MIVLDASAAVEFVLGTPTGAKVRDRMSTDPAIAPHLIDAEVAQTIRRFVAAAELTAERGRDALGDFASLRLVRYAHLPLLGRVWELRENSTAYDALYLSLAESAAAPLLTTDRRLASIPGCRAEVEVVG